MKFTLVLAEEMSMSKINYIIFIVITELSDNLM